MAIIILQQSSNRNEVKPITLRASWTLVWKKCQLDLPSLCNLCSQTETLAEVKFDPMWGFSKASTSQTTFYFWNPQSKYRVFFYLFLTTKGLQKSVTIHQKFLKVLFNYIAPPANNVSKDNIWTMKADLKS